MRSLICYFARHRTAAALLMLLMLLAGLYGGVRIRTQFLPDVAVDMVNVQFSWSGAGPTEIDQRLLAAVEPPLMRLDGVTRTRAAAREGSGFLNLFFEPGWDMARALDDVRAAVAQITSLPPDAEMPLVRRVAYRDRVADIVLWGDMPVERLARDAVEVRNRLFAAGVTQVALLGAPDPVFRIEPQPAALIQHDLTLAEIARAVRMAVDTLPAGAIGETGPRLRAGAERRGAGALGDITLRREADGARLRVRDVAQVALRTHHDFVSYHVDGVPAIRLKIERLAGEDALSLLRTARAVVDAFHPALPAGIDVAVIRARADMIGAQLGILIDNALLGLLLVLVFLFLFLSARTALWVAAGIPVSMAASIGLMYAGGLSLDMMSLFALIICLGVVVDDAIVVGEHADMLVRRGVSPPQAAERAALRMFPPVLAASLTTVLAFLALTAIGGRFGAFILAIPLTVSMVLMASLLESFLILPAHMRWALAGHRRRPWYDWPSRQVDRGVTWVRDHAFLPLVWRAVRGRYAVLFGVLALLLHAASMVSGGVVQWRFFSAPERAVVHASFAMLPGATRAEAQAMLDEMKRALAETDAAFAAEHGMAPVVFALGTIGGVMGRRLGPGEAAPGAITGGLAVELIDPDRRPYAQGAFMERWQAAVRTVPRVATVAMRGERSGPGGDAVSVTFAGQDAATLKAAAEALRSALAARAEVAGLEDSLPYDRAELSLRLTPLGEMLGLTEAAVGQTMRARLSGIEVATFPFGTRSATVAVSLPGTALTADFLDRAQIRTPDGVWVPLPAAVTVAHGFGFATIRRENGAPVVTVNGDFTTEDVEAQAAVRTALEQEILPAIAGRFDVGWRLTGLAEQEQHFLDDAWLGFVLCLGAIYLTLAWLFASWSRPLVVLTAMPLGLIGVVWGHHWMATPLSMFSVVGMIGMAGIVINDSIVLVTTADGHARHRAMLPAIVVAAGNRMRAVFLTTATTVAGLAPLLFEHSTQAQFLRPTVVTLVFGLSSGMVLVLLVTPALLAVFHDLARAGTSARRLLRQVRRPRRGLGPSATGLFMSHHAALQELQ